MTVPRPLWKGAGGPPIGEGDTVFSSKGTRFGVAGGVVWDGYGWSFMSGCLVRLFDTDAVAHRPRIYPTGGLGHRAPTGTR